MFQSNPKLVNSLLWGFQHPSEAGIRGVLLHQPNISRVSEDLNSLVLLPGVGGQGEAFTSELPPPPVQYFLFGARQKLFKVNEQV